MIRVDGDARHGIRIKRTIADRHRHLECIENFVRRQDRHAFTGDIRQQAGKLIAADAAELIAFSQDAFAHALRDAQHEGLAPLQAKEAVDLFDFWYVQDKQAELTAFGAVLLYRAAENLHEGCVFRRWQGAHDTAFGLAACRQRSKQCGLQKAEALQREQILRALVCVAGIKPQAGARENVLETQAIAAQAFDRFVFCVERPFAESRIHRTGG